MKNFPKRFVFMITAGLLLSYSCKKDEPVVSADACVANANLVTTAATTYGNNPTKANCEAYLASINKYLDSCPGLTTAQRNQYKADIAATKCP
jgi:hypothetical protein